MRNIYLILIIISFAACAQKPILRNTKAIDSGTLCLKLTNNVNNYQYVHAVFLPKYQPKKDKIYYYYNLSDFITLGSQKCTGLVANIAEVRVGGKFVTKGKGKSLNQFLVDMTVNWTNNNEVVQTSKYSSQSNSETRSFLASKKTQYIQDSFALKNAFKKIVEQIIKESNK